eukprot:843041-Rhodomonas_salina.1
MGDHERHDLPQSRASRSACGENTLRQYRAEGSGRVGRYLHYELAALLEGQLVVLEPGQRA